MPSLVKVDGKVKDRLEELQAEIHLQTGANVTQQELFSRLVSGAYESRTDVIDSFRANAVPLLENKKETIRSGRICSGIETDEDDIDKLLYG